MSIQAAINSAPSLRSFGVEAQKGEAVALKKDGLQTQPARQGFFGRIMQWIRGENPARINSDTKQAFVAAMTRRFGSKAADTALAKTGFHGGNDQPLTSREIKLAIGYARVAEGKAATSALAAAGAAPAARASGQALALKNAMRDVLNSKAETASLRAETTKLRQSIPRFRAAEDHVKLEFAQNKLRDTKELLSQANAKLERHIATVNELSGAPLTQAEQPETHVPPQLQRCVDSSPQREMLTQAKLGHRPGVQEYLQKTRAAEERLLPQTSNMVDSEWAELEAEWGTLEPEEAPLDPEWAALQKEMDKTFAQNDAISAALSRPIGRR